MRVVFDTNVFIAAALTSGFAEDVIAIAVTTDLVTLVTSEDILSELRDKLLSKFEKDKKTVKFFIDRIRSIAKIVKITEKIDIIKRDPDDNRILECAVSGNADLIVSSDQDLIKLKEFRGIGIIHPKTLSWTFPECFKKSKD